MNGQKEVLISIVIPTFRRVSLALDCVESVFLGEGDDYEILVMDQDPSRELERALQQKYPENPAIRYFCDPYAGLSRAKNLAIERARGDVIAVLDDDVLVERGWLRALQSCFLRESPPDIVAGRARIFWEAKRPDWYPVESEGLLGSFERGDVSRELPAQDLPIGCNMALRRSAIAEIGGFDESLGFSRFRKCQLIAGEDSLFGLRARKAGLCMWYEAKAAVRHRIGGAKLTFRYFVRRHFWEGVTRVVVSEMAAPASVLRMLGSSALSFAKVVWALLRLPLPGLHLFFKRPSLEARMLLVSKLCLHAGIVCGVALAFGRRILMFLHNGRRR